VSGGRSEHLMVYGLVGVALYATVGLLIVASKSVISSGWLITLSTMWLATAGLAAATWRRTVWVPLLASIVLSTVWMIVFFGSR
jgi:hypothetical protein